MLTHAERLTLLSSIVKSPLITVSRLELSTAEAAAFISRPRLNILREVYLVAKEEERKRREGDMSTDLVVQLPNVPLSPSAVAASPEGAEKRPLELTILDKENVPMFAKQPKLVKTQIPPRLQPLATSSTNYFDQQPFTYIPSNSMHNNNASALVPPHLSPYPSEFGYAGSDYGRSPNPEMGMIDGRASYPAHPGHLAPLLNQSHTHSPIDSPLFPQSATLAPPPTASAASAFYTRTNQGTSSFMQQQQIEYLQSHSQNYDYGSPYLADTPWDGGFAQPV